MAKAETKEKKIIKIIPSLKFLREIFLILYFLKIICIERNISEILPIFPYL